MKSYFLLCFIIIVITCNSLNQQSSFLQAEITDDDDVEVKDIKKAEMPKIENNDDLVNMLETTSTSNSNAIANYSTFSSTNTQGSRPAPAKAEEDNNRYANFRNKMMKETQDEHQWHVATRENTADQKYSKQMASQGKKNPDDFITFLGFLRDTSKRAGKKVEETLLKKYKKILKNLNE